MDGSGVAGFYDAGGFFDRQGLIAPRVDSGQRFARIALVPMGGRDNPASFGDACKGSRNVAQAFHETSLANKDASLLKRDRPIAITKQSPAAKRALDLFPDVLAGTGLVANEAGGTRICPDGC